MSVVAVVAHVSSCPAPDLAGNSLFLPEPARKLQLPLDFLSEKSVISVMTEIPDKGDLPPAVRDFVLLWGNLGERWGVNRSVSQIHALLYASERALTAEEIADTLNIARSNVSTSLRELQGWDIVRAVAGDGRPSLFLPGRNRPVDAGARIAQGRKARELDPAAAALRQCLAAAEGDRAVSPVATERLHAMLEFVEQASRWYEQMASLPKSQLAALMKLGSGISRWLSRRGARRAARMPPDGPGVVSRVVG